MDIRPIRTDDDHTAALREIERLWDAPEGSPDADKMDVLATLVDAYEGRRWSIEPGTPRDMLVYACGDMGRSQAKLAELLGSRSQASDLLSGRQRVSLEVAQKVSAAWAIPIQLLVTPYEQASSADDHARAVIAFFDTRAADEAMAGVVDATTITEHMPVLGADGEHVGTVDHLDGADRLKLTKNDASGDKHHFIPLSWVERVDTHVLLKRSAADTRSEWMKV